MTAKKPARKRPSRAKAKSPAATHGKYFDILTGQMTDLPKESFVTEANVEHFDANFLMKIHDGNFTGAVEVKIEGDTELAVKKLAEHYLINEPFRELVNSIINGALAKQAESIKKQLSSIIVKK